MIRKEKIQEIIDLHEKMRGCYNYNAISGAASRRSYEKRNSMTTEFMDNENNKIMVVQETTCSCRNIYYKMKIYINGNETNKNIRFIKKFL